MYFLLITVVLVIPMACSAIKNKEKKDRRILLFSIVAVFLVMALKATSVGRDIVSYKQLYEMMEFRSWNNYDLSWMEWGYELLTMIFVHVFHASFQMFMVCVYAFVYFSYYCFIKRYSKDYTTSVLLYICFTFFTFDTSAVRTMLGVAICLFAVPFAEKKGIKNALIFFVITLVAAQIHKSAYIFIIVYFVIKVKFSFKSALFYIGLPIVTLVLKSKIYSIINLYVKSVQEASSSIGGNMLIYIICLLLTGAVWLFYENKQTDTLLIDYNQSQLTYEDGIHTQEMVYYFNTTGLAMRMIYMAIIVQLFSAGTVLARMAQYMQLFILVLIPNNVERLNVKSKYIFKMLLYIIAILYFWYFSLAANALDIVPYKFYWNM
jgi:hypothetical protein